MKRPVFVVGCPRSGTTLLYSMLVAAGGFAVYRKETYLYDLAPRFPDLATGPARACFAREFLAGYLGKVPGLDVPPIVHEVLSTCRRTEEFLPQLLSRITVAQQMDRWVEATPVHVLHMLKIKRAVPDALFVHVIRDGRDCAISNAKQGWVPALPGDADRRVGVASLFWEWMVRAGREAGRTLSGDYLEIRFERLLANPAATLEEIGGFIDHALDYDRVRQHPVHALHMPNTSFQEERRRTDFNPVGRWKDHCRPDELRLCEELVGPYLSELGYPRACAGVGISPRARSMRATYLPFFRLKHWLKSRTVAGRYMTSSRVWAEPPRAGEPVVHPIPSATAALAARGREVVAS